MRVVNLLPPSSRKQHINPLPGAPPQDGLMWGIFFEREASLQTAKLRALTRRFDRFWLAATRQPFTNSRCNRSWTKWQISFKQYHQSCGSVWKLHFDVSTKSTPLCVRLYPIYVLIIPYYVMIVASCPESGRIGYIGLVAYHLSWPAGRTYWKLGCNITCPTSK